MPIAEGGTFSPENRIVSPGVFTREFDQTGVAQGVADIGGVIVAPFPKGPAFSPTLFTNVNDLQNVFGVPDGVLYGPYTAAEYLIERGLVTVTRVGGLTGYEQKYPFAIWAQSGSYERGGSVGTLNSSSSFVFFSGSISSGFSSSVAVSTGSITASNVSFTVKFQPFPADNVSFITGSQSGSLLYSGQTISLGLTNFDASITSSISSSAQLSASIANGTFVATLASPTTLRFTGGTDPFEVVSLYSGIISSVLGLCNTPVLELSGIVSGSFGQYDGIFTPASTPTFDPCTNSWETGSGDLRLLAVLNDTQYAGISDLKAPGFSGSTMVTSSIFPNNSIGVNFNLTLKNTDSATPYGVYQFSLDESDPKYITNVFGINPMAGNPSKQVAGQKIEAAYLYKVFENAIAEIAGSRTHWQIIGNPIPNAISNGTPVANGMLGESENFTDAFSRDLTNGDSQFSITNATTPWILSQQVAPWQQGAKPTRSRLFRFSTMSDGTDTNKSFKIEISNVKLAGTVNGSNYGSFTVGVRRYSDTDKKPAYSETFPNCNLDPLSSNFIARRIGDRYNYINNLGKILEFGTFKNNSKNIRVEMIDSPYPVTAIPYGFEAFATPIDGSAGFWTPTMKYTKASVYGLNPGKYPSGITFDDAPVGADVELMSLYPTSSAGNGVSLDNKQYLAPLPVFGGNVSIGRNIAFALDDDYELYGVGTGTFLSGSNIVPTIFDVVNEPAYVKMRKFVLGFQGGFDGQSPAIPINVGGDISPSNTQGLDCTTVSSAGSVAYNQCIATLGNSDEFDINLIVVPGILHQHHPYVTNLVVDMCEKRGDCFFILDMYSDNGNPGAGQISQVVTFAGEYDTNYAATYYPWIKILDTNTNKIVTVPASVVLPAVYAANDKVAAEWFAPAGLNRGGIPIAIQVTDRTTHEERDTLYEGKVNPIAAFPGNGIVVWGQKTLQNSDSALNRINVRRLLINIKKFFASTSKYLVFEQNVSSTRNKFLSIVNPYLESVQQRAGLYAFFVKMDETNNTPDVIDQNILYGQIYLKPTKTAEFIVLDFSILPTGANFPNA
jgi:hypothetical protein